MSAHMPSAFLPIFPADSCPKEFEEYAYGVSHDLSAPVRAMVEFSRLIMEENGDKLEGHGKEYLELIVESGVKLQSMMDGLLSYSRLNTLARPFCKFNGKALLEAMLDSQYQGIHCMVEWHAPPTMQADLEQIKILFKELLDNAIKFQPAGAVPKINIYAKTYPMGWHFAISDNGIGIAPAYYERIFKLFQRLHTDDEYPGTGIGLTIARKIVQRHGGRIWCESAGPNAGTTFYFTLPYIATLNRGDHV